MSPIIHWYPPPSLLPPSLGPQLLPITQQNGKMFQWQCVTVLVAHIFRGLVGFDRFNCEAVWGKLLFFSAVFKIIFGFPATEGQTKWRRTGEFRAEKLVVKERKCEGVWEIAFSQCEFSIFTREIKKNSNNVNENNVTCESDILTSYWLFLPHVWMKVSTWEIYMFTVKIYSQFYIHSTMMPNKPPHRAASMAVKRWRQIAACGWIRPCSKNIWPWNKKLKLSH